MLGGKKAGDRYVSYDVHMYSTVVGRGINVPLLIETLLLLPPPLPFPQYRYILYSVTVVAAWRGIARDL